MDVEMLASIPKMPPVIYNGPDIWIFINADGKLWPYDSIPRILYSK